MATLIKGCTRTSALHVIIKLSSCFGTRCAGCGCGTSGTAARCHSRCQPARCYWSTAGGFLDSRPRSDGRAPAKAEVDHKRDAESSKRTRRQTRRGCNVTFAGVRSSPGPGRLATGSRPATRALDKRDDSSPLTCGLQLIYFWLPLAVFSCLLALVLVGAGAC